MFITVDMATKFLAMISTAVGLIAMVIAFVKRKVKQEAELQEIREDLEEEKKHTVTVRRSCHEEQTLIIYGLLACLKGLKEQGCNGPVTEAIDKIEKHINIKAHE